MQSLKHAVRASKHLISYSIPDPWMTLLPTQLQWFRDSRVAFGVTLNVLITTSMPSTGSRFNNVQMTLS